MGVSGRAILLVHQRDDLSGQGAGKLAEEDEAMSPMPGIYEPVSTNAGVVMTQRRSTTLMRVYRLR